MEVKPGYKQSEVGVIPEDWDVDCLSRFWNVTDCKHVTAKFIASGYPVASIKETQSRFVDLTYAKQTTQQFYNLLTEGGRKPVIGDLILSRNATVGEVAQVADWHPPFAMGQDVCLLRRKSHDFSPDFLQAIFRSAIIGNQLSDLMVGSTFKRVNVQQIKNFVVPMPGPAEQEAIAEALNDADALIESLEQLLTKKRQIKTGVMQELLTGKKRLPGFNGEWVVKRLGEIGDVSGAGVDKKVSMSEVPVRLVNYLDVYHKTFLYSKNLTHEVSAKSDQIQRCVVKKGDIFFTPTSEVRDDIGRSAVAMEDIPDGVYSYHVVRLRLKTDWNIYFRAYAFNTKSFVDQASMQCEGSGTRYVITLPRFRAMTVRFPPRVEEQAAIATILSDIDAEIAALEAKLSKARQIKQGMMQELLTGRIRLI